VAVAMHMYARTQLRYAQPKLAHTSVAAARAQPSRPWPLFCWWRCKAGFGHVQQV